MKLTRYTDYALRVLTYVGVRQDRLCSIREIAQSYAISENHLMKVVHELGKAGFISTARGRGGGIRLARPADEIRIGDVVRRTEGSEDSLKVIDCGGCTIAPACVLTGALDEAFAAFMAVLDRYTLADLVRPGDRLRQLFADWTPKPSLDAAAVGQDV